AKWIPARVKKTRQHKNLEPRSGSIGTEKALRQRQVDEPNCDGQRSSQLSPSRSLSPGSRFEYRPAVDDLLQHAVGYIGWGRIGIGIGPALLARIADQIAHPGRHVVRGGSDQSNRTHRGGIVAIQRI